MSLYYSIINRSVLPTGTATEKCNQVAQTSVKKVGQYAVRAHALAYASRDRRGKVHPGLHDLWCEKDRQTRRSPQRTLVGWRLAALDFASCSCLLSATSFSIPVRLVRLVRR